MLKRYVSALTLLSVLTIYLGACKNGINLDWYVVDPELGFASEYVISNEPGDLGHVLRFENKEADGLTCLSPEDHNKGLSRCRRGEGFTPAIFCSFYHKDQVFGCSDGEVKSKEDLENWPCLEPYQWDMAIQYCQRKRKKK